MIEICGVSKTFGTERVLDCVEAAFLSGQITGIVGRNGSGKTVLLKCIIGLMRPDEGEVRIEGKRIGKDVEFAENTGFIIEQPGFLADMSGMGNLRYLAAIRGKVGRKEAEAALRLVGLDPGMSKRAGKYSMGMKQRLAIAQALMEDPDILILDEPMNGLDDRMVNEMRKLLETLCEKGKTILLTSHNSADIYRLCHEIYRMDHGKMAGPYTKEERREWEGKEDGGMQC